MSRITVRTRHGNVTMTYCNDVSNCGMGSLHEVRYNGRDWNVPNNKKKVLEMYDDVLSHLFGRNGFKHTKALLHISDRRRQRNAITTDGLIARFNYHKRSGKYKGTVTPYSINPNSGNYVRAAVLLTAEGEN